MPHSALFANVQSPGFRTDFGSETIGCGFHLLNIWLVCLTPLISIINDNDVDNNLKEILVYINSGLIVHN